MNEDEFFTKVNTLIGTMSDQRLSFILSNTEEVLEHLIKTKYYQDVERDIRDGHFSFDSLDVSDKLDSNQASIVVWLSGFRVAVEDRDPHRMLFQMCMFVAAQRLSIFRITDDKIRLVMTHIHLEALERFLRDE